MLASAYKGVCQMATVLTFTVIQAVRRLLKDRPDLIVKMEWEQAYSVGVSPAEWSRLKSGKRSGSSLKTVLALCRGFGVDLPTFLRLGGMPEEEVAALMPYLGGKSSEQSSEQRNRDVTVMSTRRKARVDSLFEHRVAVA